MKKPLFVLAASALTLLAACSESPQPTAPVEKPEVQAQKADAVEKAETPAAEKVEVTKPTMPAGSPPAAPELKFDANGNVIMPTIVAPAPPKPEGGPQAPGLTPEMLEAAKAHLAKKQAQQKAQD